MIATMQVSYIFCIPQKINFVDMYNGPYLRVLTPRTTDGTSPLIGADDKVQYKEAHLPLSAKAALEDQNRKLPKYLQKRIEVVSGHKEPAQPKIEELDDMQLEQQLAKLMAIKAQRAGEPKEIADLVASIGAVDTKQQQ